MSRSFDDGVLVDGMFLEGAKWDSNSETLAESDPKVLYTESPLISFKPVVER